MSKPTQATIFRKRQVLPARGLNKALQEYGSAGGSIPYLDDGTQDGSMTAPLGTKTAPFGNAFFKGFNIYTETEVQALVEAEKITSDDRFVFWDLASNSLKAWDGEKIVSIGGSGGNMEYIFGNGQDGIGMRQYAFVPFQPGRRFQAGLVLCRADIHEHQLEAAVDTGKLRVGGVFISV